MIYSGTASMRWLCFLIFSALFFIHKISVSQCALNPTIAYTPIKELVTIDNFAELTSGVTVGAVFIDVTSAGGGTCAWDLFLDAVGVVATIPYSLTQGVPLALPNIDVRARNTCQTTEQAYIPGVSCPDPSRICNDFGVTLVAAGNHYIIGSSTAAVDGILLQNAGAAACSGVENINDDGTAATTPNTHRFRIDVNIIPGMAPVITPGLYTLSLQFAIEDDFDGSADPVLPPYELQIDIQPIIQLKMSTPSQIDFTFDDVKKYNSGIVKFGATILEVSSSLTWDLMAVGTSAAFESAPADFIWDNPVQYSTPLCAAANYRIPLEALELRQTPANPTASGAGVDYSTAFPIPVANNPPAGDAFIITETNNIEVGRFPYILAGAYPTGGNKTIAGNWDFGAGGIARPAGSFQIPPNTGMAAGFRYVIDYRLVPGLPVTFDGFMADYACPGVYLMEVKYILAEDQ